MRETTAATYLKDCTLEAHRATERLLLGDALRDRQVSPSQYRALILTTARVWARVGQELEAQAWVSTYAKQIEGLRQAAAADAAQFSSLGQLQQEEDYPPFANPSEVLGAMYVLLGSTLGGRMIGRALMAIPALSAAAPFRFYEACGDLPRGLWPEFKKSLDEDLSQPAQMRAAGERAISTFALYATYYPRG